MGKLRDKILIKKSHTFHEAIAIATMLIVLDEDRREMWKKESNEKAEKRKDEKKDTMSIAQISIKE